MSECLCHVEERGLCFKSCNILKTLGWSDSHQPSGRCLDSELEEVNVLNPVTSSRHKGGQIHICLLADNRF